MSPECRHRYEYQKHHLSRKPAIVDELHKKSEQSSEGQLLG